MSIPLPFQEDPDESADTALERALDWSQNPFVLVSFAATFVLKLDLVHYFQADDIRTALKNAIAGIVDGSFRGLKEFIVDHGLEAGLALATYFWWAQFSGAVKNEKKLLVEAYKKMKIYKTIGKVSNYGLIKPAAYIIPVIFLILSYLVDRITYYCFFMIIFCMFDIFGNNKIRTTLTDDFWKDRFSRDRKDGPNFAADRAEVLENYWIRKPQLQRIGFIVISVSAAIIVSTSADLAKYNISKYLPYIIVILVIVSNQVIMISWRRERDSALRRIDKEEARAQGNVVD